METGKRVDYVCVFAAAANADDLFKRDAYKVGQLLGEKGFGLVYGGTDAGLMRLAAQGAHDYGATIKGVVPRPKQDLSVENKIPLFGDEIIHTESLIERKRTMLRLSRATIALAGGIGTFDEITTALEISRGVYNNTAAGNLVILNTNGYYDGLKMQLERMRSEKLIHTKVSDYAFFADTPEQAIEHIEESLNTVSRKLIHRIIGRSK